MKKEAKPVLCAEVTVSRIYEHTEIVRGWKEANSTRFESINRGWFVALYELGVSIGVGTQRPDLSIGDKLILTLRRQ
jgi:hypothetical protein